MSSSSSFLILICFILTNNGQTILDNYISSDFKLTQQDSPYIVNSYVTFGSNANITIENGVQLIFIGSYFISVFGHLNCGCSHHHQPNSIRGLSNPSSFVHLFGNESVPTSTGIFINQQNNNKNNPPLVQFCNTLFENIQNGIVTTSNQHAPYIVTNSEFRNVNNAIQHSTTIINLISNSYIHGVNHVKDKNGAAIFDNCLFREFNKFSTDVGIDYAETAQNVAIRNSEIYGNGMQICLDVSSVVGDPQYAIFNNLISDCLDGIEIWNAVSIKDNIIRNCTRWGVHVKEVENGQIDISQNIFLNIGQYDVLLNNVQNVRLNENVFMDSNVHNITIYGNDCDIVEIVNNDFVSLRHDKLLYFEQCDDVRVVHNSFIGNENEFGLMYFDGLQSVNVSDNYFGQNEGEYVIKIVNSMNAYIAMNNISNCTVFDHHLIDVEEVGDVHIEFNEFDNNHGDMLSVYDVNDVSVQNNSFYHNFGVNLLYFAQTTHSVASQNIFSDNKNVSHILYFELSSHETALIERNKFMQSEYKIESFISANDQSTSSTAKMNVHFNDFYDGANNVKYFIISDNVHIDANDNYWSKLMTFSQIQSHIFSECLINITRINEQSNSFQQQQQCRWQQIDCDNISNFECDSDTLSPTISISPTLFPTLSPTNTPAPTTTISSTLLETMRSTEQIDEDIPISSSSDTIFFIIVGTGGITIAFCLFGTLLLYVYVKFKKLKLETVKLNKDLKASESRRSFGLDAIGNEAFLDCNPNTDDDDEDDQDSEKALKPKSRKSTDNVLYNHKSMDDNDEYKMKLSLKLNNCSDPTPRPPPRRNKQLQQHRSKKLANSENSEDLYAAQLPDEVLEDEEGNETGYQHHVPHKSSEYDLSPQNMMMNAVDTMPHHGELSLTVQHSISMQQFNSQMDSKFDLKLDMYDLAELNDEELHISHLNRTNSTISEMKTETSASSKSFTIESDAYEEDEQKINLRLTSMDMMVTSPTNDTNPGSSHCVTPRPGSIPTTTMLDPDQILHSLSMKHKHKESINLNIGSLNEDMAIEEPIAKSKFEYNTGDTPPGTRKLPKPMTKGHWM